MRRRVAPSIPPDGCEDGSVDARDHHFGPIVSQATDANRVEVDVGALVRRLILFERCTVESNRLTEIPALVAVFGVDGLLELLDSGTVRVICDAMTAGQIGQTAGLRATVLRGGPLPLGSYRLSTVGIGDRHAYLHGVLQNVHRADISFKDAKRLKRALTNRLLEYPSGAGQAGIHDVQLELRRQHPVIWDAIRAAVGKETGLDPGPDPDFRVHPLEEDGEFRIETTLGARLGLPPDAEHRVVGRGILAAAALDQRIRLMESLDATTGFRDDEVALLEQKMSFVLSQVDPTKQERRFDRVLSLGGLPSLEALPTGTRIDVRRLLRLREAEESRELRAWLRQVDAQSDAEIVAKFGSIRAELASVTRSPLGKVTRFLISTAAGLMPVVGPVVGGILSGADTFLLERVLGRPGPAVFLGSHYPSIFLPDRGSDRVGET